MAQNPFNISPRDSLTGKLRNNGLDKNHRRHVITSKTDSTVLSQEEGPF